MTDTNTQTSQLRHLEEFRELITNYAPGAESLELFTSVPLVILVGPTAAGRNTLIGLLTQTGRYTMIVSDTTRQKRSNNGVLERDGREYWFKTEEQVLEAIRCGEYIEAAIIHNQQVSGAHINEFMRAKRAGLTAIKEIEPGGAELYHRYNPQLLAIFLLPPDFATWMQRLHGRGDMGAEELVRRLKSAEQEILAALDSDYYQFVINNEIHEAAEAVDALAGGRAPDVTKQQRGIDHAGRLLVSIREYLAHH
jgi:guanylate kinase